VASSWFRQNSVVSSRPPAGNANRWAASKIIKERIGKDRMLNRIIVNALYLVPLQVNKFKKLHPAVEVLIADGTKARMVKSNDVAQYEIGWATARRGVLMLTTKELVCGDWTIPLSTIQEATLLHISGGSILKLSTNDGLHYQFGMQRNSAWDEQKLFPVKIEQGALKFSKTSLVLRLLFLLWVAYLIGQSYLQNGLSLGVILMLILFIWSCSPLLQLLRFPKAE